MSFGVSFQVASSASIVGVDIPSTDDAEGGFAVVIVGYGASFVVTVVLGLVLWRL